MPVPDSLMTPRFLYFDLGNVLFRFDTPRACCQMADVSGVPVADVATFFAEGEFQVLLETGRVTPEQIYSDFCERFGVQPSLDAMCRAASDIFSFNAPLLPLLVRLTLAGYRMGILSNTSSPHWEFLNRQQYWVLSQLFEVTTLSYQVHALKPDREIYQAAAQAVNMNPDELFFTDDLAENVQGAQAAGWQAAQFTTPAQLASDLRRLGMRFNY